MARLVSRVADPRLAPRSVRQESGPGVRSWRSEVGDRCAAAHHWSVDSPAEDPAISHGWRAPRRLSRRPTILPTSSCPLPYPSAQDRSQRRGIRRNCGHGRSCIGIPRPTWSQAPSLCRSRNDVVQSACQHVTTDDAVDALAPKRRSRGVGQTASPLLSPHGRGSVRRLSTTRCVNLLPNSGRLVRGSGWPR